MLCTSHILRLERRADFSEGNMQIDPFYGSGTMRFKKIISNNKYYAYISLNITYLVTNVVALTNIPLVHRRNNDARFSPRSSSKRFHT